MIGEKGKGIALIINILKQDNFAMDIKKPLSKGQAVF